MAFHPDDVIDLNDFNVDLTGLTCPSRTQAWVKPTSQGSSAQGDRGQQSTERENR